MYSDPSEPESMQTPDTAAFPNDSLEPCLSEEEQDSDLTLPRGGHPSRLARARTANAAAIREASFGTREVKKALPDGLPPAPATPAASGIHLSLNTSCVKPEVDSQAAQLRNAQSAPSLGRSLSRCNAADSQERPGAEWLRRRVDSWGRRERTEQKLDSQMTVQIAAQSIRATMVARDVTSGASSEAKVALRAATLKRQVALRAVEEARKEVAMLLAQAEELEKQASGPGALPQL